MLALCVCSCTSAGEITLLDLVVPTSKLLTAGGQKIGIMTAGWTEANPDNDYEARYINRCRIKREYGSPFSN